LNTDFLDATQQQDDLLEEELIEEESLEEEALEEAPLEEDLLEEDLFEEEQPEEKLPRRKTIAVITSTMAHTLRAEMLSHFSSMLVERGWDITLITNNRQDYFDFLIDYRVKRYSMDTSYNPMTERPKILAKFVEDHPEIDQYLFWDVRMKTFCKDFDVIRKQGKPAFIAFWDSMHEISNYGVKKKKAVMDRIAKSEATVSSFPLDSFIEDVTYIPYLYPYALGDLSQAELGTNDLILFTSGSSARTNIVVQKFARLVRTEESFQDKTLRIVPVNKKLAKKDVKLFKKYANAYPENIFLEELCEKPHKILDGNAGVIIVDNNQEHPKLLSIAVGKGLPTLLVKGYDDYGVKDFNKGFRICRAAAAEIQEEFLRFFDPQAKAEQSALALSSVDTQNKNRLLDCWESLLLGHEWERFGFESVERVLQSCVLYMKNLNQQLLQRYAKAAKFNGDPIVKRAKKRVGKMKKRRFLSPTWVWRKVKQRIKKYLLKFHYWENNRRFNFSFIELDKPTQEKLRLLILKMFVEFERVCKENGWRYFLAGGTLLGAARHKGFIPWDDDLDVVMPRKDYDEFLKKGPALLRDQFTLNCHVYPYCFTRLELLGPRTTAPLHRKGRNIFIDVLPLDCATEHPKKRIKHEKRAMWLKLAMIDESRRIPKLYLKNMRKVVRYILLKIFCPYKVMIKLWTKNATKYQSDDAKYWVCLPGDYGYEGEMFPKETWENPDYLEFEGMIAPVMRDWDTYLSNHYGDYMTCPPLSQRGTRHRIYSITLERYDDMTVEEIAQELSDDYFNSTGKRLNFMK